MLRVSAASTRYPAIASSIRSAGDLPVFAASSFSRDSVSGLNLTCINPRDRPEELYARFRARLNEPFSLSIFFWTCKIEYSRASGRGGHPGTYTSTGLTRLHPCTIAELLKTPPE